jgi:hypothetical protein
MGLIHVGFFEDFRGADTLPIDVDAEGPRGLIAWLRDVISPRQSIRAPAPRADTTKLLQRPAGRGSAMEQQRARPLRGGQSPSGLK